MKALYETSTQWDEGKDETYLIQVHSFKKRDDDRDKTATKRQLAKIYGGNWKGFYWGLNYFNRG